MSDPRNGSGRAGAGPERQATTEAVMRALEDGDHQRQLDGLPNGGGPNGRWGTNPEDSPLHVTARPGDTGDQRRRQALDWLVDTVLANQ